MAVLPSRSSTRALGSSGLAVGRIGYGTWRLAEGDESTADRNVGAAIDAGMTLIDAADVYGLDSGREFGAAEALLGKALTGPGRRDRIVLATKGGIVPGVPYDSSAVHLVAACEASLARLATDRIDLYQIHRPDLLAHPAEAAEALVALRDAGKIREAGLSNVSPSQFETLQAFLPFPLVTNQPELSALQLDPVDDGTLDQCLRLDVTPLAWSPLGGGRLASARDPGERIDALLRVLDDLAAASNTSRSAVALAFVLAHPAGPVPIVGTQRPERIAEAWQAFDVEMTRPDWYRVVEASRGEPLP